MLTSVDQKNTITFAVVVFFSWADWFESRLGTETSAHNLGAPKSQSWLYGKRSNDSVKRTRQPSCAPKEPIATRFGTKRPLVALIRLCEHAHFAITLSMFATNPVTRTKKALIYKAFSCFLGQDKCQSMKLSFKKNKG